MEDAQGIHIQEMVKAFRDIGHEVDMVALVKKDQMGGEMTQGKLWGLLRRCLPDWVYELMSLAYNLHGYRCLCRAIRPKRTDLIYERYSMNTLCGIWASRRFHIPLILEVNSPLYYEQKRLGKLAFKRLALLTERWICSNSKKTIVVSRMMKEFLKQEGVPEEKMVVIHNGIDPEKFNPHIPRGKVRQRYGLNGKVVLGFVGWFRRWHGLQMLLEVFREADLGQRGMKLILIGDGPSAVELHRYVREHGLVDQVVFTGPVERNNIPAYIAAIDIAVQPMATEYACPMKIFEYMAMKKCIVAPDQANIREILENEVRGLLFKKGDKESLRSTLLKLHENKEKREAIAQMAYQKVFECGYLWQANAQKVLSILSS
jgi:glycosyltransferase involved in cell wall biosynthesis